MDLSGRAWFAALLAALLGACAGNGAGLDAAGQPIAAGNAPLPPLTADFQSLQDNVFTPICVRCHSGAAAPQGLQLDAAHSYALLVGVPSTEEPNVLRVDPSAPDKSYLVLKLEGATGIVGAQMPLGEPPLPQATIDFIRQWISDGALQSAAPVAASEHFTVTAVSPPDHALVAAPALQVAVAFNHEVDASLINDTTVRLERLTADGAELASDSVSLRLAAGNPRTLLVTPGAALGAGTYRLTLRGSGGGALADNSARTLERDYSFEFTVDGAP
ncbi:MAG: Ig-like domain-containing protein [Steroidobacteraceae bacterium]